jgi:hypothetical protein
MPEHSVIPGAEANRYRSIEAASRLRQAPVMMKRHDRERTGYDVVLDDLEPKPYYEIRNSRIAKAVNSTLACYERDAYAPTLPDVAADCTGCHSLQFGSVPKQPVSTSDEHRPTGATFMNVTQTEAVQLEANDRALALLTEQDSFLMPALINYIRRREDAGNLTQDDLDLRSVINGLSSNMVMRENVVGSNLGLITAVRRRDNAERLEGDPVSVSQAVSAWFHDGNAALLPRSLKRRRSESSSGRDSAR